MVVCLCVYVNVSVRVWERIPEYFVIVRCLAVLVSICVSLSHTHKHSFFCARVSMFYIYNDDQKYGRKERNIYPLHHH